MKNSGSIVATLIGGAIIGAAATICMSKKSSHLLGKTVHQAILDKLNFIQGHIDECCCMMGACNCKVNEKTSNDTDDDGSDTAKK
ncbi:MAG: hypothetical protein SNH79_03365 [Rikenellaceae bacterium]